MQIEVKIDAACGETKLIVVTDRLTDEVQMLVKRLSEGAPQVIAGFRDGRAAVLSQQELIRLYAAGGKVYAVTADGEYSLRLRLYELEERLSGARFVRISNSEIINLEKVRGFDLSISGTICVTLSNGTVTYVSRRFVSKIRQSLGLSCARDCTRKEG